MHVCLFFFSQKTAYEIRISDCISDVYSSDLQFWTEATNWAAPKDLSHAYMEDLARAFDGQVDKESFSSSDWHVRVDGRAPRIETIMDKFDVWFDAAERFVARLRERHAQSDE